MDKCSTSSEAKNPRQGGQVSRITARLAPDRKEGLLQQLLRLAPVPQEPDQHPKNDRTAAVEEIRQTLGAAGRDLPEVKKIVFGTRAMVCSPPHDGQLSLQETNHSAEISTALEG